MINLFQTGEKANFQGKALLMRRTGNRKKGEAREEWLAGVLKEGISGSTIGVPA